LTRSAFVDFHCHLDLYPNHAALVAECDHEGIFTLAVTTTPRAWPRNHELSAKTRHVRAALGLHPQLVAERADELSIWDAHLKEARYVGEVGLDAGPRYDRSLNEQKRVFEHILRACAEAGGKILTIHSVRAAAAVLDMLEAHLPASRGKSVLHWFTGTKEEARRAVAFGCYFSVNTKMLESKRHASMVASLPADRLLTETDGPFVELNGRPVKPSDVAATVKSLARLRGSDATSMAETVHSNLKRLVSTDKA
jgi:TatD DNase family protein